jgi:type I restriction enzyme, S subunit
VKRRTLQQLSKSITSGITPFRGNPEFWIDGSIPWLKTEQLGERDIYDTNEKITEKALSKTSIKLNPANTISIAMYGEGKTRGNVSILREEMTTNQACCNVVLDQSLADFEYVYYFLKNQYLNLRSLSSGVRKNLNSGDIKGFTINLPDTVAQQKKIAAVLSTLDAKIELNHRINHELEGLAKLLYDYWFVQYDFPLSAAQAAALGKPKLAGQPYRTSGGKMLFNPTLKREIPKEWTCATLGELFNLYQPQTITDKDLKPDGDYFVYGANGIVGKYDRFNHEKPQIALTCRGSTCGNLTRTLPRSWITGNAMVMAPRDPNLDIEYIFNVANASGIGAIITGSGQPQITRTNLQGVKTISPDPDTLARYQGFAHPISQHRISLEQQNQELTALRDWLLPMLMNGQVRVHCPESRGIPQKGKSNK